MGVGAEGEACVVVPQHTADRFHVNAVLESYCGECVSQTVERDVFQVGILKNFLVELSHGVRVVHLPGGRRREHILAVRVFAVLLDQEVYRLLGDGDPSHGGLGFRAGEGQFPAGVSDILFADEDGFVLDIQVIPEKGDQLTFPQSADQG